MELAHRDARMVSRDDWLFALAWLAAARLMQADSELEQPHMEDLLRRDGWSRLLGQGLPEAALDYVWLGRDKPAGADRNVMSQALAIVSGLSAEPGESWDLLDASALFKTQSRVSAAYVLAPELADLMVGALAVGSDTRLWVPFDPSGQLSIRAIRAGAHVLAVGPSCNEWYYGGSDRLELQLLLILEGRPDWLGRLHVGYDQIAGDVRAFRPTDVLVSPPWGMRVPQTDDWQSLTELWPEGRFDSLYPWSSKELTEPGQERVESWVLRVCWAPSLRRGVFLVPPLVLFAKGKERRLRESLVWHPRGNQVFAMVGLPARSITNLNIAPAMVVLSGQEPQGRIRLLDLGAQDTVAGQTQRQSEPLLDAPMCLDQLFSSVALPPLAVDLSPDQLDPLDFNLQPSRYLRRASQLAGPRVPLGDLVTVVRAPTPTQEVLAIRVWEIGIPQLDGWQAINGPFDKAAVKHTALNPRKADDVVLRSGDLVVSIKGTIGKAGLVGAVYQPQSAWRPATTQVKEEEDDDGLLWPSVVAQSCIALRLKPDAAITPEQLLLYLRSADFQLQIEALRKGSTVPHISPAALLQEVQVPLIDAEQAEKLALQLKELTTLESLVRKGQQGMRKIQNSLWPVDGEDAAA